MSIVSELSLDSAITASIIIDYLSTTSPSTGSSLSEDLSSFLSSFLFFITLQ